jgi:hypothetical protein
MNSKRKYKDMEIEAKKTPKYHVRPIDGKIWVTFERGVVRECAERCGVSCEFAEWGTIAQAYNGIHSRQGIGNSFFFDSEVDAIKFAELVSEGNISGYFGLYMAKIKDEIDAKKTAYCRMSRLFTRRPKRRQRHEFKIYNIMVTLKFTAEKASKQLVIIPTVVVDYSDKAKRATIELFFGWLNGMLGVSISWTRKVKNNAANGVSDEANVANIF